MSRANTELGDRRFFNKTPLLLINVIVTAASLMAVNVALETLVDATEVVFSPD